MIATKVGDGGYTTLNDKRISKGDSLIETLGDIDETISAIVLAISSMEFVPKLLPKAIEDLHDISAYLSRYAFSFNPKLRVSEMEELIYSKEVLDFKYPTNNHTAALLNMARSISRRAERSVVRELPKHPEYEDEYKEIILKYLNRLSDYLFVLSVEEANNE